MVHNPKIHPNVNLGLVNDHHPPSVEFGLPQHLWYNVILKQNQPNWTARIELHSWTKCCQTYFVGVSGFECWDFRLETQLPKQLLPTWKTVKWTASSCKTRWTIYIYARPPPPRNPPFLCWAQSKVWEDVRDLAWFGILVVWNWMWYKSGIKSWLKIKKRMFKKK